MVDKDKGKNNDGGREEERGRIAGPLGGRRKEDSMDFGVSGDLILQVGRAKLQPYQVSS